MFYFQIKTKTYMKKKFLLIFVLALLSILLDKAVQENLIRIKKKIEANNLN